MPSHTELQRRSHQKMDFKFGLHGLRKLFYFPRWLFSNSLRSSARATKKVLLESDLALFVRQVYNTNVLQVQDLRKAILSQHLEFVQLLIQGRLLQLRQHQDALPYVLLAKVAELLRLHPRL